MKKKLLIGEWVTEDMDSRVIINISIFKERFKIIAFDPVDGERFKVSAIKWSGGFLSFSMFVPSTRYRTRNCIRPLTRNRFLHAITFREVWKRRKSVAQRSLAQSSQHKKAKGDRGGRKGAGHVYLTTEKRGDV